MKVTRKRVPDFKNDKEVASFWDKHDLEDFDLEEVDGIYFDRPRKRVLSIRLDDPTIRMVKALALRKGVSYSTLIRMWVVQNCKRQAKA